MGFETDKLKIDMLFSSTLAPRVNGLLDWSDKLYDRHFYTGASINSGGTQGLHIAYCPINNYMYMCRRLGRNVAVINCTSNTVVTSINLGTDNYPYGIAYCPTNNCMYVSISNGNVKVINCISNSVVATIGVGSEPEGLAYNPVNNRMYVCNGYFTNTTVSAINCSTNTVAQTITVGAGPRKIAYCPVNNYMYVCNHRATTVSVIDCTPVTNTVVENINIGTQYAYAIAYCSINNCMYIGVQASGASVYVVSCTSNAVIDTLSSIGALEGIVYSQHSNHMYTLDQVGNTIPIDCSTNTIKAAITIGVTLRGGAYCPVNGLIYMSSYHNNNIYLVGSI